MLRVTDELWELIRKHFPEQHIPEDRPGRKPTAARKVLEAVLLLGIPISSGRLVP